MSWLTRTFDTPRRQSQSALSRIYDDASRNWHSGIRKLGFAEAYAHLVAHLPIENPQRVLDVGTGSGALAEAYVDRFGHPEHLCLMDISLNMLEAAQIRLPLATTLCLGIGATLDLPKQDRVLVAHVIEHLPDPVESLRWIHALLRPGGTLVLALSRPHWCTALVRWRWGNAAFTPEAAETLLKKAGFTQIQLVPFKAGPSSRISHGYIARRLD